MAAKNKINNKSRHEHPLPHEITINEKRQAAAAHNEAEKDMDEDAELSSNHPNDDLDEGESARLGEGKNELI